MSTPRFTKIVASHKRLYALAYDSTLWFRGPFKWERVADPCESPDNLPAQIVDIALGTVEEHSGVEEYLYVLMHNGRVFMQDYPRWTELT